MKRKHTDLIEFQDIVETKKIKKEYESIVAFECNCENYCYPCKDNKLQSITLIILTNNVKTYHYFSTNETNFTEKDILEKSLNILKSLKSFRLVSYGMSYFNLNVIQSKCKKYKLNYTNLFVENTLDLFTEIPKYIKLQRYKLEDVTKNILGKEIVKLNENDKCNSNEHCEMYLELLEKMNNILI